MASNKDFIDASAVVGLSPSDITVSAQSVLGNNAGVSGPAGSIALSSNSLLGRTSGSLAAIPTVANSIIARQGGDVGALAVTAGSVVCNAGAGLVALALPSSTVLGTTSGGVTGAVSAVSTAGANTVAVRSAGGQCQFGAASADADATIRSQQNQRRNGVVASARLLLSNQPTAGDTIGIGADTYEFDGAGANINVTIGGSPSATCDNLVAAINTLGTVAIKADNVSGNCRIQSAATRGGTVTPGSTNAALTENITDAADVWDIGAVNLNTTAGEAYSYVGYASAQLAVTTAIVAGPCVVATFAFNVRHFIVQVRTSAGVPRYVTDAFTVIGGSSILWSSAGATHMANGDTLTIMACE